MKRVAHRAIDRAVRALTPADGATPFRPAADTCGPDGFFCLEGPPPEVVVERTRRLRLGKTRALRTLFAFPSPMPSGVRNNDTVRGFWVKPLQREVRASIVFLHRWKASAVRPMRRMSELALGHGVELLLPALPYHGWRRPRLTSSGVTMIGPDLDLSLRSMRQAVLDVRSLLVWLQARGHGPILLAGVDLGGIVAALTATVHEGLSGLVVVAAHDRWAELLWTGAADRGRFRGALERAGLAEPDVAEAWSVLDPGWRLPLLDPRKVLLVGGRYDEACGPEGIERFAARWGGARIEWLDFAHGSAMLAGRAVMREALALLDLGREPVRVSR